MVEVWVVVAIIGVASSLITWQATTIKTEREINRSQKETIQTQDRLITQLEIAGKLQDKLYGILPPPPPPGGPTS